MGHALFLRSECHFRAFSSRRVTTAALEAPSARPMKLVEDCRDLSASAIIELVLQARAGNADQPRQHDFGARRGTTRDGPRTDVLFLEEKIVTLHVAIIAT